MEVYFAINRNNGKCYTGWTKTNARKRFRQHCNAARRGSPFHFHNAIRKHGADAFDVLTIHKGNDAEEMKQVERNVIAGMKTNDPRFGYNMTEGGENPPDATGIKRSEETREKHRAVWRDPEYRKQGLKHLENMRSPQHQQSAGKIRGVQLVRDKGHQSAAGKRGGRAAADSGHLDSIREMANTANSPEKRSSDRKSWWSKHTSEYRQAHAAKMRDSRKQGR